MPSRSTASARSATSVSSPAIPAPTISTRGPDASAAGTDGQPRPASDTSPRTLVDPAAFVDPAVDGDLGCVASDRDRRLGGAARRPAVGGGRGTPVSPAVSRADSRSRAGMQPSCVLTVLMPMGCRVHRQLGVPPQSSVVAGGRPTRSSASAHLHRSCWTRSAAPRQPDPTCPTCGQTSRRQRSAGSHRGTSPSPRCCSPEPHTRGSPRRWEPTARCRSPRPTHRRAAAPHHAADTRRGRLLPTLRRHLRPTVPTSHRRAAAARLHGQSLTTAPRPRRWRGRGRSFVRPRRPPESTATT
jgi:hypothetical protein